MAIDYIISPQGVIESCTVVRRDTQFADMDYCAGKVGIKMFDGLENDVRMRVRQTQTLEFALLP